MAAAAWASAAEMSARPHPLGTARGGERAARCVRRAVSAGGQSEATRACARAAGPAGRGRGERAEARSRVYRAARGEPGECGGVAGESKRTIPLCVHVLLSAWCGHPLPPPIHRLDDTLALHARHLRTNVPVLSTGPRGVLAIFFVLINALSTRYPGPHATPQTERERTSRVVGPWSIGASKGRETTRKSSSKASTCGKSHHEKDKLKRAVSHPQHCVRRMFRAAGRQCASAPAGRATSPQLRNATQGCVGKEKAESAAAGDHRRPRVRSGGGMDNHPAGGRALHAGGSRRSPRAIGRRLADKMAR